MRRTYIKVLSANDIGKTGGHQAGILIPKSDGELLKFLPKLNVNELNPSAWIECLTPDGSNLRLRYVYYNNRLHSTNGTRNEYRVTHLTKFLRDTGAREGDRLEISRDHGAERYRIRVVSKEAKQIHMDEDAPVRIKLSSGWQRVH
jgi:hypothetical protein